jgi:hypothetical protein
MELEELARQIQRTWDNGARRGTQLPFELDVSIGLEQRSVTDRYDWYGLQRGSRNSVVIQYTLSGWGMYTDAQGRSIRLDPGMFFVAIVPSDHRYYLPRDSPTWRFFYVVLLHPWTHARMARTLEQGHAVQVAAPDAPFTAGLVRMWSAVRRGEVADDIAMERLLMDLALEHDRLVRAQRDGGPNRRGLRPGSGSRTQSECLRPPFCSPNRPLPGALHCPVAARPRASQPLGR